ncbi:iron-sulfur cluster carrier protein ApbC [Pseudomarimonas arenosa]|uniref:Iron-sulfur cluster carrier protein n=1 Tax=Pseudomarimonas arenosa TaxID=2774145 RepID=A0AAW3ZNE5_9GAMM|nr:iron-sulfur cluster carrier protein ApbC [Pseudomarimonas arenosa]MBD8527611.1 iron-sulfur cluster carrier protein ApbC [Pseudomarimonas arenosa]
MSSPDLAIRNALAAIQDPHLGKDIIELGYLKNSVVEGDGAVVELVLPYPAADWAQTLQGQVETALRECGHSRVKVLIRTRIQAHEVQKDLTPLPGVRNIIAVASGKGGVGKSTTTVNLALALQAEGAKVGVLDADIYGPSIPRMLDLQGKPESPDGKIITPKRGHGLQAMSIGLLIGEDTPMIWRGPMATQALQQMLTETAWEDLDYLIIDLPPGTGDIQLTLCQRVPLSGAVIVTTPQDIALLDAKKALKMFEKVEVPVLGVVENMAIHVCSNCGHAEHIFGSGGGEAMSQQYGVPLLGSLPLDIKIREQADGGQPTVAAQPDSDATQRYREIARKTAAHLAQRARHKSFGLPKIVISDS